ncbi:c-type cytochrome biogenesis protein CcmI [bacterium]|nr:c-type cytochrome biogenesis protein CcmI [bacterium]
MTAYLIGAFALLTVLAALFVLWALRMRAPRAASARQQQNINAYKSRVAELDAERDAGRLTDDEHAALEAEAAAALLAAQDDAGASTPGGNGLLWASALIAPAVAIALYLFGGGLPPVTPAEQADALIAQLVKQTEQNPHDIEAYANLGRANMMVNRFQAAADAYARANQLTEYKAPELIVSEGEALGLARGEDLLGRPAQLFEAALEIAPNHTKGLWYASLAAAQQQNQDAEQGYLQRLAALNLPEAFRQAVDQRLANMGVASNPPPADVPPSDAADNDDGVSLTVNVQLDDAVANQIPAGSTLFVFAKMPSGPPMPLAVRRIGNPSFPLSVRLTENDAMMPNMSLATAEQVLITARLSASGTANAQAGDAQGSVTTPTRDIQGPVEVLIDTVVE